MTNLFTTRLFQVLMLAVIAFTFGACEKEVTDIEPKYDIPTTYNFENVSYSGQTQRLAMLLELKTYMAQSQQSGVALDADRMKAMYANTDGADFQGTYESSKQLKSKTFEPAQADFDSLFDALAKASQSTVEGTEGQAGVIQSLNGEKQYLVGERGLDHAQLIEKGLMGACLYYQSTSVYMGDGKMNVDNEVVIEGEGTEMEHHWDEAFGYLGVPTDFPTNTDGLVFWGSYTNKRDAMIGSNQALMDALIKGRAAISNQDVETRDIAIEEAREAWEMVGVASALHYFNAGVVNFDDMSIRSHALSEAIGFVYGLQFNEGKQISNEQVAEILGLIAGSADFATMNLYDTTIERIEEAREKLATIYNVADKQTDF